MLTGKVSEYLYMPIIEHVNGLVLRRKSFVKLYDEHYWQSRFGNQICSNYIKNVRKIVNDHREQTSELFENRIDYVDMSAFGINHQIGDYQPIQHDGYTVEHMGRLMNEERGFGKIAVQMKKFNTQLDSIQHQIYSMSSRYDSQLEMIFKKYFDKYPKSKQMDSNILNNLVKSELLKRVNKKMYEHKE